MNLKWHNTDEEMSVAIVDIVKEDLKRLDVDNPQDLVFHHIFLTNDYNGPCVFVWGVEGSDAFHCEYCEKTQWKTGAELDAEHAASALDNKQNLEE